MSIPFSCPSCRSNYNVSADLAGKSIRCRKCHTKAQVVAFKCEKVTPSLDGGAAGCPSCGFTSEIAERLAGKTVKCPRCHTTFLAPGTAPTFDPKLAALYVPVALAFVAIVFWIIVNMATSSERSVKTNAVAGQARDTFLSIRPGMAFSDVKLLLGSPDKVQSTGRITDPAALVVWMYNRNGVEITIVFDANGNVLTKNQRGL